MFYKINLFFVFFIFIKYSQKLLFFINKKFKRFKFGETYAGSYRHSKSAVRKPSTEFPLRTCTLLNAESITSEEIVLKDQVFFIDF